ncbi:uncharacterized protein LOC107219948 [Neodiprion lecontei]|uniref:Uncharacterized protein LOC107219948 n=1 Tax=Neodiprion lecontei TaxID=441921 RepID=A0A6J0BG59_NEOLC|nr:uncharacterized protein LOC107219948 [Neodiprion lecontei]
MSPTTFSASIFKHEEIRTRLAWCGNPQPIPEGVRGVATTVGAADDGDKGHRDPWKSGSTSVREVVSSSPHHPSILMGVCVSSPLLSSSPLGLDGGRIPSRLIADSYRTQPSQPAVVNQEFRQSCEARCCRSNGNSNGNEDDLWMAKFCPSNAAAAVAGLHFDGR